VHGLWNGMAVLSAASSLQGVANIPIPASLQQLGTLASVGIIALGVLVLVLYVGFNATLRRISSEMTSPPPGDGQTPKPPGNEPRSFTIGASPLPTTEINASLPIAPDDNQASLESASQPLAASEIPPPNTETNP